MSVAVRGAAHFDRDLVSVRGGLLAAIPVAAVLGGGLAVGDPVAGVTMGAGAMLVGIAWRNAGGRPPLVVMAIDALVMSLATFIGSVTGSVAWLHFVVLVRRGAAGRAAVRGRQPWRGDRNAGDHRGGGVRTVQRTRRLCARARCPRPRGRSRRGGIRRPRPMAVTAEYAACGDRRGIPRPVAPGRLAASRSSSLPAAGALDEAAGTLASPHLFGDAAIVTLRSLVTEGQWIRVQLSVIRVLLDRQRASSEEPADGRLRAVGERALALAADALNLIANAIDGDRTAERPLAILIAEFSSNADALAARVSDRESTPGLPALSGDELQLSRRISALAGQLRAVSAQAPAAGRGGGLRSRRPHPPTNRPLHRVLDQVAQVRANISLQSSAGRHALRLAAVVAIAELIAGHLALDRSYWMVVAAAAVLRPEFSATFTRGAERALGTSAGVALAGAIVVATHPGHAATVVIVGLLAWAGYATYPASFASGFCFITAMVVFLINILTPDTLGIAGSRLLDTLIGSAIGLLAYVLWPTWSRMPARESLAALVDAQRAYLSALLAAVISGRPPDQQALTTLGSARAAGVDERPVNGCPLAVRARHAPDRPRPLAGRARRTAAAGAVELRPAARWT